MLSISYTHTADDDTTTTDTSMSKRQKTNDETQQSSLASTASARVWREVQVSFYFYIITIAQQYACFRQQALMCSTDT
jgi:hypothetical protein